MANKTCLGPEGLAPTYNSQVLDRRGTVLFAIACVVDAGGTVSMSLVHRLISADIGVKNLLILFPFSLKNPTYNAGAKLRHAVSVGTNWCLIIYP